jgi:hypothetical protein
MTCVALAGFCAALILTTGCKDKVDGPSEEPKVVDSLGVETPPSNPANGHAPTTQPAQAQSAQAQPAQAQPAQAEAPNGTDGTTARGTVPMPASSARSPVEFGKEAAGQRAPGVPDTLDCPAGTELRRQPTSLFCRYREPHTVFHGPYIDLSPQGTIRVMKTMVDGKEHGITTRYSSSGMLQERRSYQNGKKHGPYAIYDEEGKLQSVTEYRDDKEHGTITYFRPDGSVRREEHFVNGVRSAAAPE